MLVIVGSGIMMLGAALIRFRSNLALPPNRDFAERRWLVTGILFLYALGPLTILASGFIFYRVATGGEITFVK
jgi:hypothetical protein